jgi:hypothetical protein
MTDYRLIPSHEYDGEPARIDLNLSPEFRAYMAHDEEILYVCRHADVADHAKYLRGNGNHVSFGPTYEFAARD